MLATQPHATSLLDVFKLLFLVLLETIVPRSRASQKLAFAILSTARLLYVMFRFVLPRMMPFVTITICVRLTVVLVLVSMQAAPIQQNNVHHPTNASLRLVLLVPDVPLPHYPHVTITTHVQPTLATITLDASILR